MKKLALIGLIFGLSSHLMAFSVTSDERNPETNKATCKTKCKTTCSKKDSKFDIKQSINIGFVSTSGNTETTNLNGKYEALATTKGYADKKLEINFDFTALVSENNDIRDNEEYRTNFSINQFINDKMFVYGSVKWFKNQFLNYNANWNLGTGLGWELVNNERYNLKVKAGVAHNIQEFTTPVDGSDEDVFTSMTQYIEYNRNLNETSKLYAKLGLNENIADCTEDYDVFSTIGLNFKVAEDISVILEQELRYDSIPAGEEKTDTKTMAKIGYTF